MELSQAIEGIMRYRKAIHEQDMWNSPNDLSEVMLKLATYNAYVSDHLASLHYTATETAGASFKAARDMEVGVTEGRAFCEG